MGNLTLRERAMFALVALVGVAFLVYLFGIRPLNENYENMKVTLAELTAQKEYYDQLKISNAEAQQTIKEIDGQISELEKSFIADVKTENIAQYVMSTFEKAGNPFLATLGSQDVATEAVTLPDGTVAEDKLVCKRIIVQYASTDGYEVTQYNTTPDMSTMPASGIQQIINNTGKLQTEGAYGYDEFINGLKEIEKKNPSCVKINEIDVIGDKGYFQLTASIDFYGVILKNRVSADSNTDGYAAWAGDKGVDTKGGFIGMPYVVKNPDSAWNGVMIDEGKVGGMSARPFASYISNAQFTKLLGEKGLQAIVGGRMSANTIIENEGEETEEPA